MEEVDHLNILRNFLLENNLNNKQTKRNKEKEIKEIKEILQKSFFLFNNQNKKQEEEEEEENIMELQEQTQEQQRQEERRNEDSNLIKNIVVIVSYLLEGRNSRFYKRGNIPEVNLSCKINYEIQTFEDSNNNNNNNNNTRVSILSYEPEILENQELCQEEANKYPDVQFCLEPIFQSDWLSYFLHYFELQDIYHLRKGKKLHSSTHTYPQHLSKGMSIHSSATFKKSTISSFQNDLNSEYSGNNMGCLVIFRKIDSKLKLFDIWFTWFLIHGTLYIIDLQNNLVTHTIEDSINSFKWSNHDDNNDDNDSTHNEVFYAVFKKENLSNSSQNSDTNLMPPPSLPSLNNLNNTNTSKTDNIDDTASSSTTTTTSTTTTGAKSPTSRPKNSIASFFTPLNSATAKNSLSPVTPTTPINTINDSDSILIPPEHRKLIRDILLRTNLVRKVSSTNKKTYRIVEIEYYYISSEHSDPYVHQDPHQHNWLCWYFHRQNGKSYKSGTYKGLDISIGSINSPILTSNPSHSGVGGLLIRSIINNETGEVTQGPCKVVNELLGETPVPDFVDELQNAALTTTLPVEIYSQDLLTFERTKSNGMTILRSPRVGLTFKRITPTQGKEYLMAPYRYTWASIDFKANKSLLSIIQINLNKSNQSKKLYIKPSKASNEWLKEFQDGIKHRQDDDIADNSNGNKRKFESRMSGFREEFKPSDLCYLYGYLRGLRGDEIEFQVERDDEVEA